MIIIGQHHIVTNIAFYAQQFSLVYYQNCNNTRATNIAGGFKIGYIKVTVGKILISIRWKIINKFKNNYF